MSRSDYDQAILDNLERIAKSLERIAEHVPHVAGHLYNIVTELTAANRLESNHPSRI